MFYFNSFPCCLLKESKSAWSLIGFCFCWESSGSRGAALGKAAGSPSAGNRPSSKITTNWHFGVFFTLEHRNGMRCEQAAQGGDSWPGLGCTNLCWGGIPAQEWGAGCCGEELPCTGYFWPHNLSSVSRAVEIKTPQGGRSWALLEPRIPGIWGEMGKAKLLGEKYC